MAIAVALLDAKDSILCTHLLTDTTLSPILTTFTKTTDFPHDLLRL
ncbi:hypothetical protein RCH20_001194 [Psychrobacter sp. PL15]|nr:hypothetical protein [Psychrobacter sp. PL15]